MAIITTTKGDMDESLLEKKSGFVDNDHEYTEWLEYWLDGELVHRSVHVQLKLPAAFAGAETATFG